jgi:hypothetical protein
MQMSAKFRTSSIFSSEIRIAEEIYPNMCGQARLQKAERSAFSEFTLLYCNSMEEEQPNQDKYRKEYWKRIAKYITKKTRASNLCLFRDGFHQEIWTVPDVRYRTEEYCANRDCLHIFPGVNSNEKSLRLQRIEESAFSRPGQSKNEVHVMHIIYIGTM